MEHKPLSDLCNVADLVPETPKASLTRRERLERWIQVLDREPGRALNTLHQIEHKPLDARRASRSTTRPCPWPSMIRSFAPTVSRVTAWETQSTTSSFRTRRLTGRSARASMARA